VLTNTAKTYPQARALAVPAGSALAVQARTAQLQEKEEQQQLKRLVLGYEQREELEELRGTLVHVIAFIIAALISLPRTALENRNKYGAVKIRYAG
jgi:regulator of nonsense transcripts 2